MLFVTQQPVSVRWIKSLIRSALLVVFLTLTFSARSLTFNLIYDASVNILPNAAQIKTALAAATGTFTNQFTNAITINVGVYWGNIGPFVDDYVDLGENIGNYTYNTNYYAYNQFLFTYGEITNALRALRNSADDSNSVASLPSVDPIATNQWWIPLAEARALRLHASSDTNIDGDITFAPDAIFTFDPANRIVVGKYDFIGVAEHEISEMMGRSMDLNYNGGAYIPYDLFRFTNNGARSFGINDKGVYFSVNKGLTPVKYFYTNVYEGDIQDWLPSSPADTYDAFVMPGEQLELTPADFTALDILGYNGPLAITPLKTSLRNTNGTMQISFTNNIGATFFVLSSTNPLAAITNWTYLGMATQGTPGHFQFNDVSGPTNASLFYRLRSP